MLKRVLRNILIIVLISSLCGFIMPIIANATQISEPYTADSDDDYNPNPNEGNNDSSESSGGHSTGGSQDSENNENEGSGKTEDEDKNNEDENNQGEDSQGNENNGSENKNTEDGNLGEQNREDNNQSGNNNQNSENNSGNTETGDNTENGGNGGAGNSNEGSGNNRNPAQNVQTSADPVKSGNTDLRELKVNVEGMTPDFNSNITEYYLIVDLSIETINVTATPADNKAKVEITGNANLKEGENNIRITVTAENETKKDYIIHVTKTENEEKANANLKSLSVNGYNISPDFKYNVYNYTLLLNTDVESLNIIAEAENDNAKVEIKGNSNLQEGENLIEINVTAEDEITVKTYKIKVFIDTQIVNVKEEDKLSAIILLTVLVVCVIIVLIIKIKNKTL